MLKLDPITHDLIIENFQYKEISTKTEDLAQRLKIKLLLFKGEWFLDEDYGIPYFQDIFVKGTTKEDVDDIFRVAISNEIGVDALLTYESIYTTATREFSVAATVKTTEGEVVTASFSL
jgi:hypothetical protein